MSADWVEIREAYTREYSSYRDLAKNIEDVIRTELASVGLHASVEGRPKDPLSLVLKAFRKRAENPQKYGADPLSAIGDKAGVRVIVDHLGARATVGLAIETRFEIISFEDTAERYKPNELGYLGQHYEVRFRDGDLPDEGHYLEGLQCEIQVHTR